MSELSLECSSCGQNVPFGHVDQVKETGIVCTACASSSAEEVEQEATTLLREHVAFGQLEDGGSYVMIGGKKITDSGVVEQFERLYDLFWG